MSYNTRLQTANTNLQSLIDKANALPDASTSGGGLLRRVKLRHLGMSVRNLKCIIHPFQMENYYLHTVTVPVVLP